MILEGLAGCVRERKKYQTNINNDKIMLESMINQRDAKNIGGHQT